MITFSGPQDPFTFDNVWEESLGESSMPHDARSVANEIIRRAQDEGIPVTPMKVLKLTYFCQAWMLGLYGRPIFRQPIEAWMFGPVVADVYHSLQEYGGFPVDAPIHNAHEQAYDRYEEDLIEQVWRKYKYLSGIELSALTHREGTPWFRVRQRRAGAVIPSSLIRKHYESLVVKDAGGV